MEQKTQKEIKQMHEELSLLPRIKICEAKNIKCLGGIERHHALTVAGKRLNEPYAIRALCSKGHHRPAPLGVIDRRADLICKINAITEGLEHLKKHYPKTDWDQELRRYKYDLKYL